LWEHADFLKLWTAQTISVFGDHFTELAIPLIAVLTLGATPGQMGILTAVTRAPFLLIGLFAGVWVDRLPRRPVLITGDLGRAVVLLSIPLAAALGSLSMLHLYAVGVLVGILTVFFDVAYQAYLPALVHRGQLLEGNSKLEATRSLAGLAGAGGGAGRSERRPGQPVVAFYRRVHGDVELFQLSTVRPLHPVCDP
jgi:MFS family permease